MAVENNPDKYNTTIPSDDRYDGWDWKQIKAAITGGAAMSQEKLDQINDMSKPDSLWDAGVTFLFVQRVFEQVGTTITMHAKAIAGDDGVWKGPAADGFMTAMEHFGKVAKAHVDQLADNPTGNKPVANGLVEAGNKLSNAIYLVNAIDSHYAQQAINVGADTGDFGGDGDVVAVGKFPQIVEMMTRDMRNVIKELAGDYTITHALLRPPPDNKDFDKGGKDGGATANTIGLRQPPPPPNVPIPDRFNDPNLTNGPGAPDGFNPDGPGAPDGFNPDGPGAPDGFNAPPGPGGLDSDGDGIPDALDPDALGLGDDKFNPNTNLTGGGNGTLEAPPPPKQFTPPPFDGGDANRFNGGGLNGPPPPVPFRGPGTNLNGAKQFPGGRTGLNNPNLRQPPPTPFNAKPFGGGGGGNLSSLGGGGRGGGVKPFGGGSGLNGPKSSRFAGGGGGGVGDPDGRGRGGRLPASGRSNLTGMPMNGMHGSPMGHGPGGGGGKEQERERSTWLVEDEDVWGADPDLPRGVVGRDES